MNKIVLLLLLVIHLSASIIETPILTYDEDKKRATIGINMVDVGMSGFIVHYISADHSSILKNVTVSAFDKETKIATLKVSDYDGLRNNALPSGKWKVKVGDKVVLAFGYTRALLIAPNEAIYHRITKSVQTQWLHPDIYATILSFRGHPTPLISDFKAMSIATSTGLIFIYINEKVYTLDAKSFTILSISAAPLPQDSVVLPFYTRVAEIDANWWGEGSDELLAYEPHYYELLVEGNNKNKKLYNIIKSEDSQFHYLLDEFEIEDEK